MKRLRDWFIRTWDAPWFNKWAQIVALTIFILPLFLFFVFTDFDDRTDSTIILTISISLFVGVAASILTTEKYAPRGVGLLACVTGSAIYFFFIYLARIHVGIYYWMADMTRAGFIVGAPLFCTATVIALIKRTRNTLEDRRRKRAVRHRMSQ